MIRLALACAALVVVALPARAEIEITPVTSPGGITAWLYEDHTLPILTIEASFEGGAVLDPEDRGGATVMMADLLQEGAGDLDATAFAEARENLALQLGFDAYNDAVTVSATMLSESLDESLELVRMALVEPRFDPPAVERVRDQLLATIRSDATDPGDIATDAFYALAFDGHPYARPSEGTIETVSGLDVAALRAAHARALTTDRLKIAVVGDITAEALGPILDTLFGELPAEGPPLPPLADTRAPGTLDVIDLDIPQSVVMFGHEGIPREDPDYVPAFVMDHILGGGGFGSRLTEELREKRGLTYGVYTYLAPNDLGWLYLGRFSTANARVAEAIELVRGEWRRLADEGVTEQELDKAKRYLTGAYPLRFSGNASIAGQLLGLQTAGLGLDYVNERNDLVMAVTTEDIAQVAERMLEPDKLTFVVVGRPEGLEGATN